MGRLDRIINRHGLGLLLRMPAPFMKAVFGAAPENDRGAVLDLQTHVFLRIKDRVEPTEPPDMPLAKARRVYDDFTVALSLDAHVVASKTVSIATRAGSISATVHRPGPGRLPALVFFHGGGFVVGSAKGYDPICRYIAKRTGFVVINVDYHLAPEHAFPVGTQDAVDAFIWVVENAGTLNLDATKIAVGGDSAGGKLAAVCCQQQVVAGGPVPAAQLLVYPTTQHGTVFESSTRFATGFFLTAYTMSWFAAQYLQTFNNDADPRVSPVFFDRLAELPPATLVTAGFDPLRDAGDHYAELLKDAGVEVVHQEEDGLIHGFWTMGGSIDAARRAIDRALDSFVRQLR